jgi:mannosyltransferase OCH1-like enzyme/glycosyltransferase involved in cell wall biosynthesis
MLSTMLKSYCYQLGLVLILLAPTLITAISIEKLELDRVNVENRTNQILRIQAIFQKECSTCSRLHVNDQKSYILSPGKNLFIKNKAHLIKNIITQVDQHTFVPNTKERPASLIFHNKKKENNDILLLLPQLDFDDLTNNHEFKHLTQGHKAYSESMPANVSPQDFFGKLKKLYDQNNLAKKIMNPEITSFKIPRTIHFIWFGPDPVPNLFKTWQQTWKIKHHGWTITSWNEAHIKEKFPEGLFNQKIYDDAHAMLDYATMSKIVRYEILHKFGGLFVEPNLKCYESFNPLHLYYDFYAGLGTLKSYGAVSNSIIGSRAEHPILAACMQHIQQSNTTLPHDPLGLGSWRIRHLSNTPLTQAVYNYSGQNYNSDIIFPRIFFDANKVKKCFYHETGVVESSYKNLNYPLETFCSRGAYSHKSNINDHELSPECLEPSITDDAASLDFISSNYPKSEKSIVVIIASYNNSTWYKQNLFSVFMQKYTNYKVIYVDDASPDGTGNLVEQFIKKYNLKDKVILIKNQEREGGAAANYYKATKLCNDDDIIVHLDGDDWFAHENALAVLNKVYSNEDVWLTYGQFQYHAIARPGYCKAFPSEVIKTNAFREYSWTVHHPRTFYAWLFRLIKRQDLQFKGKFIPASWDVAHMFPMLEMAGPRIKFIPYLLHIHNKSTAININKVIGDFQAVMNAYLRLKPKYARLSQKPKFSKKRFVDLEDEF